MTAGSVAAPVGECTLSVAQRGEQVPLGGFDMGQQGPLTYLQMVVTSAVVLWSRPHLIESAEGWTRLFAILF